MNPSGLLDGKVCVITGGAGSIGLASARRFVAEGAQVMLADLDAQALRRVVEELGADKAAFHVTDVCDSAQVRALFEAAVERFGGVDVVFSNAGTVGPIAPLADYPEDDFDRVLAVHVRGAFLCCKHGIARMRDGGSVIITSSVVGVRGDPGAYAYITAKHAQVGLMRSVLYLASEQSSFVTGSVLMVDGGMTA